jgi:hypothetical protein
MAKALNTFLKSKMNKDLDARIIPSGEYRNAVNVQVSKSEGDSVGSVENVLGNNKVFDFEAATGTANLYCIGYLANDQTNTVYVFLTNYPFVGSTYREEYPYEPTAKNYIFACNVQNNTLTLLVEGAFLNFCTTNPIYGVNILESLLFWTDNRNQPRKINVDLANPSGVTNPTYYTTEDQISVAKYNPYACMELYEESYLSIVDGEHESTMKDVVSKYYPNGGAGLVNAAITTPATNIIELKSFEGDIQAKSTATPGLIETVYGKGSSLAYVDNTSGKIIPIPNSEVDTAVYDTVDPANPFWTITATSAIFENLNEDTEIILNYNPYYDPDFAGDPDFLEDKFSRFSYRFQFEDNEYSLIAPFTQIAFIPKQDGYFMYVKQENINDVDDQSDAYRSTVVSFVENKVNNINLRIPLPFLNYNINNSLKVKNVDILYKESNAVAIKVVDTIPINDVVNSAGTFSVNGAVTAATQFNIDNLQGGIKVGSLITGFGIVGKPKVTAYEPTDVNNPSTGGLVTISSDLPQTLVDDVVLNANDPNYFSYNYQSKKPFKTLPEKTTTRVFDKIPVKALAQEVSGNRVIYGNYQDKHTPPPSLNYNVAVSDKVAFNLNKTEGTITGGPYSGTTVTIQKVAIGEISVGDFITLVVGTGTIPPNTEVVSVTEDPLNPGNFILELTNSVTNIQNADIVLLEPGGTTENSTSIIEYPNSTVKTNRNYQAGVVLSDRYGRTSTVLLSNNKETVKVGGFSFSGDTIYSGYKDSSVNYIPGSWPGDSLKILFNEVISSTRNNQLGTPGIYNGDSTSLDYNPLGWYTYKIVIKQTEQDYYNVYLPGIMASYPQDQTLELGKTSHMVLINDNINKVPRDLSEVGPQQRQFRSSVQLFGRVENTKTIITESNIGLANTQYYPERSSDTVSTISTVADLFEYVPIGEKSPRPNYFPQFYSIDSNPLIARISTSKKIGQISKTNYDTVTATVGVSATTNIIQVANTSGIVSTIEVGDKVSGPGFPEDLKVDGLAYTPPSTPVTITAATNTTNNTITTLDPVPANNRLVQGDGIPKGTIIVSSDSTPTPSVLTLNNVVNVTAGQDVDHSALATIQVDQSVTVTASSDIVITGQGLPGVQYLAVYETEPQESLLDIFWETSTSGLIADLNNAILNESSGGADLFGFNPTPFDESIQEGDNVSTSDIIIVNNFGIPVPDADIQAPNGLPLEIVSQKNSVTPVPEDVNYFDLYQVVANTNRYNIRVKQEYFDNIFFGNNSELRNFTINLQATVNGLLTPFTLQLNLDNVSPTISEPSNGDEILLNPGDSLVTTIKCRNGSGNIALSNILNESNVEIKTITNSSGTNVIPNGYFDLQNPNPNPNGDFEIDLVNIQGDSTPADRYNFTVEVQDAGGSSDSVEVSFVVDFGVKVENVKTYKFKTRRLLGVFGDVFDLRGPATSTQVFQYYTTFEVTEGPAAAIGWYLYNGPWDRNMSIVSSDLDNLAVNYANQPFLSSNNTASNPNYSGTFVDGLIQGGSNTGFGASQTGGGIIRSGNNLTILGGVGSSNLTYPNTGARIMRASVVEGEQKLDDIWRANCKYSKRGTPPAGTVGPNGIFVPENGNFINPDAGFVTDVQIPQAEVESYFWQVQL